MASNEVFQEHQEIDRLAAQNKLLERYESPIYQRALADQRGLRLLDVGCNDGSKTVARFSGEALSRIIGLERLPDVARQAQRNYGGGRFTFYQCDVERPDFAEYVAQLMSHSAVEAFDIIHISLVLLHLKKPQSLLTSLGSLLAPGGRLIVVEADDELSCVRPDPDGLFDHFKQMLTMDPLAGDRSLCKRLPAMLTACGYGPITLETMKIQGGAGEARLKEDIFEIFCSYLPEDMLLLRQQEPDHTQYAACLAWLDEHYESMRRLVLAEDAEITMGASVITCPLGG